MPIDWPNIATLGDPGKGAKAVAPNDATDLPGGPCRALYIGTAGDVVIDDLLGNVAVLWKAHPVGYLRCGATRVRATNTTATFILAIY